MQQRSHRCVGGVGRCEDSIVRVVLLALVHESVRDAAATIRRVHPHELEERSSVEVVAHDCDADEECGSWCSVLRVWYVISLGDPAAVLAEEMFKVRCVCGIGADLGNHRDDSRQVSDPSDAVGD